MDDRRRTGARKRGDRIVRSRKIEVEIKPVGDLTGGKRCLLRAVERWPDDKLARNNLLNAFWLEIEPLYDSRNFSEFMENSRIILELEPDNAGARNNLIEGLFLGRKSARLKDFAPKLVGEALGKKILIACMPKSRSS